MNNRYSFSPFEIPIVPFIDDEEKMVDFIHLSKEEFLASYSYLTEEEYEATANAVLNLCKNPFKI